VWLVFATIVACVVLLAGCGGSDGNNKQASNPVPMLISMAPTTAPAGSSALTLTVNGSGFVAGSVVQWNGSPRTTTYSAPGLLLAAIPAADLAVAGAAQVTVVNPAPGGGTSAALPFTITNVLPVASALSPSSVVVGSPAFELTVSGSGFVSGSTVQWNETARVTTFMSSTSLKAAIPAADVASAGTAQVRVVNPAPGGGNSASLTFTVQNPAPQVTSLIPATVTVGASAFELTLTGTGFVPGAVVLWNGADRPTTFVNSMRLTATIAAADVVVEGRFPVTVRNPAPAVGPSNNVTFLVAAITPPPPGSSTPVRVTVATDGGYPNGPSVNGGMNMSGRYVIFASKASNLVAGDTNDAWDIFVRDTCIDVWGDPIAGCVFSTWRLTRTPEGGQANGDSGVTASSPERSLAVSFDGGHVAFVSSASNLVAGDTNGVDDVFVVSTCLGASGNCIPQIVRVSLRNDGSQSTQPSSSPALGEDGGHVAFVSADPNIVTGDANGVADVFLRDVCANVSSGCTPGTRRISVAPGNADANGTSGSPVFTGRYLAFVSSASNLVPGDTNGVADVFMRDTCIGADTSCMPSTERISLGNGAVQANGVSSEPLVGLPMSGMNGYDYHGRFVVFVSEASNLVPGDTNGVADVFMRDTCRGRGDCVPSTQRVSLTSTGGQIMGAASGQPGHMRWDGEAVLFVTAANGVVPEDANGLPDVYLRGVCHDDPMCLGGTSLMSDGEGGAIGNGASRDPRGNYDAWVGPEFSTFVSMATNLLKEPVPSPYYGCILMTTTY
jgi:hypothetical protein